MSIDLRKELAKRRGVSALGNVRVDECSDAKRATLAGPEVVKLDGTVVYTMPPDTRGVVGEARKTSDVLKRRAKSKAARKARKRSR